MTGCPFERTFATWRGVPKNCWQIKCADCARTEIYAHNNHHLPELRITASHFRKEGWRVGAGPRAHRCPKCIAARAAPANPSIIKDTKMTETKPAAAKPSPSEMPPRVMGKDDRRIVFAKIDEVYLGEGQGYSSNWSDEKIAKDLNVPRAWVASVREDMFGPAEPEFDAAPLLARIFAHEKDAAALLATSTSLKAKAAELATQAERLLDASKGFQSEIAAISRASKRQGLTLVRE